MYRTLSAFSLCLLGAACSGRSDKTPASPAAGEASAPLAAVPAPSFALTATPSVQLGTLPPGLGIAVGTHIPDVGARDLAGGSVQLSALHEYQPVLIVFYRGGWCPFCSLELHALGVAHPDFQKRGVSLVAISVDTRDEEAKSKVRDTLPFGILSDVDAEVVNAFHVVKSVSPEEYTRLREQDVDIERYSGRSHHQIAVPSFFLVDRAGIVRWAHADPEWKVRPTTAQLLTAIDATLASEADPSARQAAGEGALQPRP